MKREWLGKVLYGVLFVAVLPVALAMWSRAVEPEIGVRGVRLPAIGAGIAALGLMCIAIAMWALWRRGHGLPMNAYPPSHYVASGIYALVPHPIYGAFVVVCLGVSLWFGSAAGLWLITPVMAMACMGLVLGYELPDLRARFGDQLASTSLFPADDEATPAWSVRFRCYLSVLLPWLVLYEGCVRLGIPPDARPTAIAFDRSIPFLPWTEFFYASTYVVVALAPLLVRTNRQLRQFTVRSLLSFAIVFPLFLSMALTTGLSTPDGIGFWASLIRWERAVDTTACAWPSYHVLWSLIAAGTLSQRKLGRAIGYAWAMTVAVSCLTTRAHTLSDVAAAVLLYAVIVYCKEIWVRLLRGCEQLANSWREWRIGPVRVINHGAYAGAAAAVDIFLINNLLGPGHPWLAASIFLGGAVGAMLWAQFIEGSPALLRPLGFYGGLLGTIAVVMVGMTAGVQAWTVFAAICFAAPWLQAIGRLRCFVQGCCHGAPTDAYGIRYRHPRSRVVRIAHYEGVPVHATQLYSILGNVFTGVTLTRLLMLHVRCGLLCGVYLILSGLFRFVEERFRGEPQTPTYFGLRLYQWVAVASMVVGACLTTAIHAPIVPSFQWHASSLITAIACGVAGWFVSGVDFPESNRRFARLT